MEGFLLSLIVFGLLLWLYKVDMVKFKKQRVLSEQLLNDPVLQTSHRKVMDVCDLIRYRYPFINIENSEAHRVFTHCPIGELYFAIQFLIIGDEIKVNCAVTSNKEEDTFSSFEVFDNVSSVGDIHNYIMKQLESNIAYLNKHL